MFIDCDDVIDNNYIELMLPSNERCDLVVAGLKKLEAMVIFFIHDILMLILFYGKIYFLLVNFII